ncbi:MAG TPA: DUF58 domain-containing protein [Chloroflexota bacterium]|nr:DUF58 domain-containing protein [Chloroflexota bacterium]
MKGLLLIGLTFLVLATALSTGWDLLYRLLYTMAAALAVSFVWAWVNVRWLRFGHEIKNTRAQVGGSIEELLTLENSSWLPKLWLQIVDQSTLIGRRGNRVLSLPGMARRRVSLVTPCTARGMYTLGPADVISGDPFGLFQRRRRLEIGGTVIVYPAITPLNSFGHLPGELPGGSVQSQRTHFVTPNASGVREYQSGDALSRIHWLSSARQNRLMVKEFELDPLSDVWLILDLDTEVQIGTGQDSTEEVTVAIAATLANYFLREQREVGIIAQGEVLPADRGHRQLHKALDLLAVIRSNSKIPLEQLVLSEETRFARGATAVIVTPSTDEKWLAACRLLAARGVTVFAVLLEVSTFGDKRSSVPLVSSLAASGVPTYLVKRGDDLALALSSPVRATR